MQVKHHNFKVLIWRLGKDFEGYGLGKLNMKIKCICLQQLSIRSYIVLNDDPNQNIELYYRKVGIG